jgi:hypothetical protein
MLPRMVVTEEMVHQGPGRQPKSVSHSFGRQCTTDEEAYQRIVTVGPEWQALDFGWVKDCGMLSIVNVAPLTNVVLSPEQRAERNSKVVEVAAETGIPAFARIRVGESLRMEPIHNGLALRCPNGTTKVNILAVPN